MPRMQTLLPRFHAMPTIRQFAAATLIILAGCNDAPPTATPPAGVVNRILLSERARLDGTASDIASGELRIVGPDAGLITLGTIIADTQASGLLRRVTAVRTSGAGVEARTVTATLPEAIPDGELRIQDQFTFAEPATKSASRPGSQGASLSVTSIPGVSVEGGRLVFTDFPLYSDGHASILLERGSLALEPALSSDFMARFKDGRVDSLRLTASGGAEIEAKLRFSLKAAVVNRDVRVATFSRRFFATVGGFPVVGRFETSVIFTTAVSVAGRLSVASTHRTAMTFTAGAQFSRPDAASPGSWTNLSHGTGPSFELVQLDAEGNVAATARVGLRVESEVILYGMIGPQAWVEPFTKISRTLSSAGVRDRCEFAVNAGVRLYTNVFGFELALQPLEDDFLDYMYCDRSFPLNSPEKSIALIDGNAQSALKGSLLPRPLSVKVRRQGSPLAGEQVQFAVVSGGGTMSRTTATTDADGIASTQLTLGPQAGGNAVEASLSGANGSPVLFVATAYEPGGQVKGTITDATTGAPIVAAVVELRRGDTTVTRTQTRADGSYTTARVATGDYFVAARAQGYAERMYVVAVSAGTGGRRSFGLPAVPAPASLSGRVTNAIGGQPVSGAIVRLSEWQRGSLRRVAEDTAGADGRYGFPMTMSGTYQLIVSGHGHDRQTLEDIVVLPRQEIHRDIQLAPLVWRIRVRPESAAVDMGRTLQLTATTTDIFRNVIPGVALEWSSEASSKASVNQTGLVTGLIGSGYLRVSARSGARYGQSYVRVVPPDSLMLTVTPTDTAILTAGGARTFAVAVADPRGSPVAGATIAGTDNLLGASYMPFLTDANGNASYVATVPGGKAPDYYAISFAASKTGFSNSVTVTRRILVQSSDVVDTLFADADVTVSQEFPNTNFNGPGEGPYNATVLGANMSFGMWSSTGAANMQYAGLIRFDLARIPAGAQVVRAEVRLRNAGRSGSGRAQIFAVTSSWSETAATWNSRPTIAGSPVASWTTGSCSTCFFEMTSLVQSWLSGSTTNHGLYLTAPDAVNSPYYTLGIGQRQYADVSQRPQLIVTYRR